MKWHPIADPSDPLVAEFRRLNDTGFRKQVEAPGSFHQGIIVGEGWLVVERLMGSRHAVRSVLVDEARVDRLEELSANARRPIEVPVFTAPREILDGIVGFPLHRGIVAVADRGRPRLSSEVIGRSDHLVVVEGVNDAENLGAICRIAATLGADGLLLDPASADPLSRRSIRVSMGHVLSLPHARLSWPEGLRELVGLGFRLVALTPSPDAIDIAELHLDPADRVAMLLGAEGPGLSAAATTVATDRVRIPMTAGVDSLNVGAAAAIAAHRLFAP